MSREQEEQKIRWFFDQWRMEKYPYLEAVNKAMRYSTVYKRDTDWARLYFLYQI